MEGSIFKSIWSPIKSVFKLLNVDRFAIAIILIIIGYATKVSFFPEEQKHLDIVANLVELNTQTWEMHGRILNDGNPVESARVWIILSGDNNNEDSPPDVLTNKDGDFKFQSIPRFFGKQDTIPAESVIRKKRNEDEYVKGAGPEISNKVKEVKIFAIAQIKENDSKVEVLRGEKVQIAGGDDSKKTIQIPYNHLVFLPTIFLISIIIPFLRLSSRLKYNFSIILAFLFSVALIVAISRGISIVSPSDTGEILSLGFVNIFWGTYVPEAQPEWLFSLTSATSVKDPSGFGVPLWVLLLSVIGSSLFTVLIIVSEIKERPDFAKLKANPPDEAEVKKFREKIENIVRHQFYMLFSPLGAIFVYQLMVAAGAVGQPITVAIAALGAGSTINLLLDKAVLASKKALDKSTLEDTKLEVEMKELSKIEVDKLKKGKE
jgi:hypothetical protein